MPLKENVVVGKFEVRKAPFADLKGFGEFNDTKFQTDGITTNGANGTSLLYDMRAVYGFFFWLQNLSAQTITYTIFYSFKNFESIESLDDDNDWVAGTDAAGVPIAGTIPPTEDRELEYVRATSRVTAVRLDLSSVTPATLNGVVSKI